MTFPLTFPPLFFNSRLKMQLRLYLFIYLLSQRICAEPEKGLFGVFRLLFSLRRSFLFCLVSRRPLLYFW